MVPTKKRARAQVIIPPDPVRDRLADEVELLDRKCIESRIEMGAKLVQIKKRLKDKRLWLAYIKMREWSRAHVERHIAIAEYSPRVKVLKLSTLGLKWSALAELARRKAPLKQLEEVEQRLEAGEPARQLTIQVVRKTVKLVGIAYRKADDEPPPQALPTFQRAAISPPPPARALSLSTLMDWHRDFISKLEGPERLAGKVLQEQRAKLATETREFADFLLTIARHLDIAPGNGETKH